MSQKPAEGLEPTHSEWMHQAWECACAAEAQGDVPVGAVVVYQGRVLSRGWNRREADNDPAAHAEVIALREAAKALGTWRLLEAELFVTLEPCVMCLAACQLARLRRVVYGAADPKGGALSLGYRLHEDSRTNHRFEVVLEPYAPCAQILRDFFKKQRTLKRQRGG